MEDLLTATLALNTTVTTKPQNSTAAMTKQKPVESQLNEQPLMQQKWKFTVPFLMLGVF
ncbi:MAG: hypothetical protein WBA13_06845 [Microcoleaceae cyanobacterium]